MHVGLSVDVCWIGKVAAGSVITSRQDELTTKRHSIFVLSYISRISLPFLYVLEQLEILL